MSVLVPTSFGTGNWPNWVGAANGSGAPRRGCWQLAPKRRFFKHYDRGYWASRACREPSGSACRRAHCAIGEETGMPG
jgi:hypothetical protein